MRHSKLLLGVVVFIISGVFSSFLYVRMGHDSDAFGLVFYTAQKPFSLHILTEPFSTMYLPLNETLNDEYGKLNFFSHYRPFQYLMFHFCYNLFGYNAYGYLLVQGVFHALTSMILYFIFSYFLSSLYAFLLALIFAFHPVHFTSFIGLTCMVMPVFLFLSLSLLFYVFYYLLNWPESPAAFKPGDEWPKTVCLKPRFLSRGALLYLLSVFLFILSLFCYELPIIFPFILLLYLIIFDKQGALKKSGLFFVGILFYLLTRLFLFGFPEKGNNNFFFSFIDLKARFKIMLINWYQVIKPFWGMQGFSKIIVGGLTGLFILMIFLHLVLEKKRRKRMLFYLMGFFLASWVITTGGVAGRYFYGAIPFFCLIFFEILIFLTGMFPEKLKKPIVVGGCLGFLFWGMYYATTSLNRRENYTYRRDIAFKDLAEKYKSIKDLKIIYLGTLQFYNEEIFLMMSGMTQASRLFFNNPKLLVYHVEEARLYIKKIPRMNFDIYPVRGGYRFVSPEPENLFIMWPYDWEEGQTREFSMGRIRVDKKFSGWQATDVSFFFDNEWLELAKLGNTIILTWDVVNWKFVELDKSYFEF